MIRFALLYWLLASVSASAHVPREVPLSLATLNLPATVQPAYDLRGNLLSDGKRGFTYDSINQLTSVSVAGEWKSEFAYDGLGRRRIARDYGWQLDGWTLTNEVLYVYDGRLVLQERDGNNQPLVSYTRGLDLSGGRQGAGGIGGLLARTDASGSAFYHADANGNVVALINSGGTVVASYTYDPYGNLIAKSGSLADANRYRFSSKEYHPLSGLYYYGFRFYDPNLQRWINSDPIGVAGGLNTHGFLGNNPVNAVDADGRCFGFVANYFSGKLAGWSENAPNGAIAWATSLGSEFTAFTARSDPIYGGYQQIKGLKESAEFVRANGAGAFVEVKYEGLKEGVGTSDIVRAVDFGDEYNWLQQTGYGILGASKTFLTVVSGRGFVAPKPMPLVPPKLAPAGAAASDAAAGSVCTAPVARSGGTATQLEFGFVDDIRPVLFKGSAYNPSQLRPGEFQLHLPDLRNETLNWQQNFGELKRFTDKGISFRELNPLESGGWLQRERNHLYYELNYDRVVNPDGVFWSPKP